MSKIVEAAGSAIGPTNLRAKSIEQAMVEAIKQCAAEGITDPDEIRRRKLEARERVKRGG